MLMINPMERLGSPGSSCGIQNLKNHPFFKGIDFNSLASLKLTDYHRSLITGNASPSTPLIDPSSKVAIPRKSAFMPSEFALAPLILKGFLLKKNRWFQKQIRYFHLYQNGELKYYKDVKKYKGKITLSKSARVLKTAKNQMEIPSSDKTYIFLEVDKRDQAELGGDPDGEGSADHELFTCDIDKWIENIEKVIEHL